jgi:hypothetical protein
MGYLKLIVITKMKIPSDMAVAPTGFLQISSFRPRSFLQHYEPEPQATPGTGNLSFLLRRDSNTEILNRSLAALYII